MSKETHQIEMDRSTIILENKMKEILKNSNQEESIENMWEVIFSLFKESLQSKGEYLSETVNLLYKYTTETLKERANEVRPYLLEYAKRNEESAWEKKEFFSLVLKTVYTEEAFTDEALIERVLSLCQDASPKTRKKALPALRRIIEYEQSVSDHSKTFDRLVGLLESACTVNQTYSGKIISILGNFHQEIARYNQVERMLAIARTLQGICTVVSIPAITFARSFITPRNPEYFHKHLEIIEAAAMKGCTTTEESILLLDYAADLFKYNAQAKVLYKTEFIIEHPGSIIEEQLKEIIAAEIARKAPENISLEMCLAIKKLIQGLNYNLFPCFKKIIQLVSKYCQESNDLRLSKEIELIIGYIGLDRFLKSIKEKEIRFWLPMIKASVHSADIDLFMTILLPEIKQYNRKPEKKEEFEALWACFPSFCRNAKDPKNHFPELISSLIKYIENPTVRGYICQGVTILAEETQREIVRPGETEAPETKARILAALTNTIPLFDAILSRYLKEQTENEKTYLKTMLGIINQDWIRSYVENILNNCFTQSRGPIDINTLKPEYGRKEKDIPKEELMFVEYAPLLELLAPTLVQQPAVQEGVLRYIISVNLRPQKMAYKVILAMIKCGYNHRSLIEMFFSPAVEKSIFLCSRYLRVEVIYALFKVHEPTPMEECALVKELINIVKMEGGKNRKVPFTIITEMAATYNEEKTNALCQILLAGTAKSTSDYQAGAINLLATLLYNAQDKVSEETHDMIFTMIENTSKTKQYQPSKAIIGYLTVLLMNTRYTDKYMAGSLKCLENITYNFKAKLLENLKVIIRKLVEYRPILNDLPTNLKDLLCRSSRDRTQEKDRVHFNQEGKLEIKDRQVHPRHRSNRVPHRQRKAKK
ncbi:hypothetical protein NEOKW01_1529 [Nematocida sp. AWRm80]|nr:hypothetical protein NEOKW01_1529 [Nematocida sp. AWRm80]